MKRVLVLSPDDVAASLLGDTVTAAGFLALRPLGDERPLHALARTAPDVVLLDPDLACPPELPTLAVRTGAAVIYFSLSWSAYDLASYARDRGLAHFARLGGSDALRRTVDEALAWQHAVRDKRAFADRPAMAAAIAHVERARQLTYRTREIVADARELRAANRIALAACRMNREVLRDAVVACTRDLRLGGISLDSVIALVTAAVGGTATEHPESHDLIAAEMEAAAQWAAEAYRAA